MLAVLGCSDEKGADIPPLVTDFLVVATDEEGVVSTVILDDGTRFDVERQRVTSAMKDTLLRCFGSYAIEEGGLRLYSLAHVVSDVPHAPDYYSEDESLPRDPLKVISMWRSGGYVNVQLGLLTTGVEGHKYGFCEDSVGHYSLLHLRPKGDAEAYTEKVYVSMPIPDGVDCLTFSVYTYDGIFTRTF